MKKKFIDGAELKKLRVDAKITQQEMADKLGLSRETIIAIEKNQSGSIEKLAIEHVNIWGRFCRSRVTASRYQLWLNYLKKLLNLK